MVPVATAPAPAPPAGPTLLQYRIPLVEAGYQVILLDCPAGEERLDCQSRLAFRPERLSGEKRH